MHAHTHAYQTRTRTGQTVRDIITDSGATVRVQTLTELTPSDPERTITILGARDKVLRGVALILNTVR
jgi:RNA-binding protein Nova